MTRLTVCKSEDLTTFRLLGSVAAGSATRSLGNSCQTLPLDRTSSNWTSSSNSNQFVPWVVLLQLRGCDWPNKLLQVDTLDLPRLVCHRDPDRASAVVASEEASQRSPVRVTRTTVSYAELRSKVHSPVCKPPRPAPTDIF